MIYSSEQLLDLVNRSLVEEAYPLTPGGLYAPVKYVLSLGGKRIRPILLLMAYNLYKESVEEALSPALGIETYHNYTLLHDDLMDKADKRRGKMTVHKKWDENTAILSGDAMLVLAYQKMASGCTSCLKDVLDLFSRTALEICEGQQFDMEFEHRVNVTEEEYLEMIRLKTAVLLACALKTGALLANASREDADLLYDFGIQIGLAFQLQDDFLDVYGDPAVFGKNIGGDILCNKKTYLLIKALECADDKQRASLESWLAVTACLPEEKIEAVTSLYSAIGVKEKIEQKMRSYFEQGLLSLEKVSVHSERKLTLKQVAEELMFRQL